MFAARCQDGFCNWLGFRFPQAGPLLLLGVSYTNPNDLEPGMDAEEVLNDILLDFHAIPWFTYRHGFQPIESVTGDFFDTDTHWGCAIRTAQMITANSLLFFQHGRSFRRSDEVNSDPAYIETMGLFLDTPNAPLSIHEVVASSEANSGYSAGSYMMHSVAIGAIARLFSEKQLGDDLEVGILTFVTTMYVSTIRHEMERSSQGVLIFVHVHTAEETVKPDLLDLFEFPVFRGFVGGDSFWFATYFVAAADEGLYYLDPHVTKPAFTEITNLRTELPPQPAPLKMRWSRLNSSATLAFTIKTEEDLDELVSKVLTLRSNFFQVEASPPPDVTDEDILAMDGDFDGGMYRLSDGPEQFGTD